MAANVSAAERGKAVEEALAVGPTRKPLIDEVAAAEAVKDLGTGVVQDEAAAEIAKINAEFPRPPEHCGDRIAEIMAKTIRASKERAAAALAAERDPNSVEKRMWALVGVRNEAIRVLAGVDPVADPVAHKAAQMAVYEAYKASTVFCGEHGIAPF